MATTPCPLMYCGAGENSEVLEDHIVAISSHPSQNILALGDIAGKITLYTYEAGKECSPRDHISPQHGNSCRVLCFSCNGRNIYSGSSKRGDLFCSDMNARTLLHSLKAHKAPLYSTLEVSEKLVATGCENGEIKLWDTRSWRSVCEVKGQNKDFISGLAVEEGELSTLLATSGDGTLTVLDLRQRRLVQQSDTNESELLSLAIVKNGKKVVCGDGEGALMIYNWGLWEDITDRYPIHPQSVDCLLPLNSSVVCTGCMDGWVRSIQILPNQLLGLVGRHSTGSPIEGMCLSHDRQYLITSTQESCMFWPTADIPLLPGNSDKEEEEEEKRSQKRKRRKKQKHKHLAAEELARAKRLQQKDFFADLCNNT